MTGGARDQVNRLLALVPYLQARGEVTVEEAADEFGVSPATIASDVGLLPFCGLPGLGMGDLIDVDLDALEGDGVIRLSNADYLPRPLRLDSTEAAALVVGLRSLMEGSSSEERELVQRTLAKIEQAAGQSVAAASQVDFRSSAGADERGIQQKLEQALDGRRQVRISHRSPTRDELTTRVVDPVGILTSEGHAYLDGWCHRVRDRRLFRLDRIASVEVLDSGVSDSTARTPLDVSEGVFRPAADAMVATVRLTDRARWFIEYFPVESAVEEPDGGLTVTLRVADPAWLVRLMLRLGGGARLVEPVEVADLVRAEARRALEQYS